MLRCQGQSIPQSSSSVAGHVLNRSPKVFEYVGNGLFNPGFCSECNQSNMGAKIVRKGAIDENFKDLLDGLDLVQIRKRSITGG